MFTYAQTHQTVPIKYAKFFGYQLYFSKDFFNPNYYSGSTSAIKKEVRKSKKNPEDLCQIEAIKKDGKNPNISITHLM